MQGSDRPIFVVALRDSFQGFHVPDIEYTIEGRINVLPSFWSEEEARRAVAGLSRLSGVPRELFRICRYELTEVLEG